MIVYVILALCAAACSGNSDKQLDAVRAKVPPITGGFTFRQYVILKPGDKPVMGSEGVFYISPTVFNDQQLARIAESKRGKAELDSDSYSTSEHLFNMCFAAIPKSSDDSGVSGKYLSLIITRAYGEKDHVAFQLYSWPDFWYRWVITESSGTFSVEDSDAERAWGWADSKIVVTKDSSVGLERCLQFPEHQPVGWGEKSEPLQH